MKKNKLYQIFVVLMSLTILCGCWDIKEINQRTLPLVIGVSKENDEEYQVSLYIPIMKKGDGKARIQTVKGDSVSSVLRQLYINSEKALDLSQVRLIVIENHLASNHQEWRELIKYFMTSKIIPSIALLAITDDSIENMFTNFNDKLGVHATSIYDFFNKGAIWAPEVSNTRVWEAYQSLLSYTKDICVPVVNSAKDTILNYTGAAVLKNGQLTERISPSENQLINLFQNRHTERTVESLGVASILVTHSSLKIRPSMKNNEPRVSSDLSVKINILERKEGVTEKQIKKELEKLIEKRFNDMLKQAQRNKTDIFGFGQYFRNRIPYHKLDNWREKYYPTLEVNFQVHVRME